MQKQAALKSHIIYKIGSQRLGCLFEYLQNCQLIKKTQFHEICFVLLLRLAVERLEVTFADSVATH
jgi:hypothetical protein